MSSRKFNYILYQKRRLRAKQEKLLPPHYTAILFKCMLVCVSGSFTVGYQSIVMNSASIAYDKWLDNWYWNHKDKQHDRDSFWLLKQFIQSSLYSLFAIGAIFGAYMMAGHAHDCGIKRAFRFSLVPATIGYSFLCITGLLQVLTFLLIGRFFIGIHCGYLSVLIPCYILELTYHDNRSHTFAACLIAYCLGALISALLGHQDVLGRIDNLDIYMSLSVITYAGQWLFMRHYGLIGIRDYYIQGQDRDDGEALVKEICSKADKQKEILLDCDKERNYIWTSRIYTGETNSPKEVLLSKGFRKQVIVACCLQIMLQICTNNIFMATCSKLLTNRGYSLDMISRTSIVSGCGMFTMSVWSYKLIQKCGRRTLLLAGLVGMVFAQIYLNLILAFVQNDPPYIPDLDKLSDELIIEKMLGSNIDPEKYQLRRVDDLTREYCYEIGLFFLGMAYTIGPLIICPLYTAELFTQEVRYNGLSLTVAIGWSFSLLTTIYVPLADYHMELYIFVPSIMSTIACLILVHRYFIETKDKSFVAISDLYRDIKQESYELREIKPEPETGPELELEPESEPDSEPEAEPDKEKLVILFDDTEIVYDKLKDERRYLSPFLFR